MNKTNLFKFLLITLLLLTYQSSTIHSSQHLFEKHDDCHVCVSSKQLDGNLHQTSIPFIFESHAIEFVNSKQRVVVKKRLDLRQRPFVKRVDFRGMKDLCVKPIPLGYLSHAPPYTFS